MYPSHCCLAEIFLIPHSLMGTFEQKQFTLSPPWFLSPSSPYLEIPFHFFHLSSFQRFKSFPNLLWDFLGSSAGKESTCNAGDLGLIPGLGRSPGGGHGNPLQYSCLENPKDRGAWLATVYVVTKNWTRLSD